MDEPGETSIDGTVEYDMRKALKLTQRLEEEHWGWKQLWCDMLKEVAVGDVEGQLQGAMMDYLEKNVQALEEDLTEIRDCAVTHQLASMTAGQHLEEKEGSDDRLGVHAVLQTYTVPLAQVRRELKDWIPSLEYEVNSLEKTTRAVRPIQVQDLKEEPGYNEMLVVPSKLVPTVKAPDGKKRSRIVLCGNLVEDTSARLQAHSGENDAGGGDSGGKPPGKSFELYASGIIGSSLRCALRKAAQEQWSIGITDVSSAFLLAPRKSSRLMVTKPPSILTEAGILSKDTRWIVEAAVYGLDSSPADWQSYRDEVLRGMRWWEGGRHYWIHATPEPNVWRLMSADGEEMDYVNVMEEGKAVGFALSYVDDFIVMGDRLVAQAFLSKLAATWKCAPPTWVVDSEWRKFCGVEMKWDGSSLLIGQPDYAREIVARHSDVPLRSSPLPKVIEMDIEETINPEDVKRCQTVIGELLWLSTRTRPDLSFAVSYLGARVTKSPKGVLSLADHVLGYVASTLDFALEYGPCSDQCDQYGRVHNLNRLEVLTDSSFAPTGGKGHQGIMAMWAGCLVAWESKAQAFATLSTTESELLGYIDGLTLGESVGAVVNVLQENILDREGSYVLRGDNLSGLQLLQAPSGPWRTRHLRLRSHVLRERLKHHLWSVEHVPGAELCADLLTKSITQSQSWDAFRRSVGLRAAATPVPNEVSMSRARKVACAAMASLGLLAAVPGLGGAVKLASLLGLAAAATVAVNAFTTATGQSNKRSNASHIKKLSRWVREDEPTPSRPEVIKKDSRWVREDEPTPSRVEEVKKDSRWLREDEPSPCRQGQVSTDVRSIADDFCHLGTPADGSTLKPWNPTLRLCAMKAPPAHRGLGTDTPWVLGRFATPPTGADRWECLGAGDGAGEWWVRVLKKSRVRSFHPLHRGTPFQISRMSPTRVTVAFHRGSTREAWRRQVLTDDWTASRNCDIEGVYEWIGYAFFYVRFVGAMEGAQLDPDCGLAPGPHPLPGTHEQAARGYGNTSSTRSRALERGRSA